MMWKKNLRYVSALSIYLQGLRKILPNWKVEKSFWSQVRHSEEKVSVAAKLDQQYAGKCLIIYLAFSGFFQPKKFLNEIRIIGSFVLF